MESFNFADEYHVSSRNRVEGKSHLRAHQVHYSPHVQALMHESTLQRGQTDYQTLANPRVINQTLSEVISTRRSCRGWSSKSMSSQDLSTVLSLSAGEEVVDGYIHRNYANSGNLGSVEVFVIACNVEGLSPGIYHYAALLNQIGMVRAGLFSEWLKHTVFYQPEFGEAAAVLVLVSNVGRLIAKYGSRGYRLGLIDVGHVSQNVYLSATGAGLSVCASAGFIDSELDAALHLDGISRFSALAIMVGYHQTNL